MAKYSLVSGVKVCNEFTSETFGRLTSLGNKFQLAGAVHQVCRCECGNVKIYKYNHIKRLDTESCGCLRKEVTSARSKTHALSNSKIFTAHRNMLSRVYDPKSNSYPNYGGRGITVCDRWREPNGRGFINFLADMGERPSKGHSIDRIDVNGNYEPNNCRWATVTEQARNRRSNTLLTYNGKTQCIAAWAEETGLAESCIASRLRLGWGVEKIIETQLRSR